MDVLILVQHSNTYTRAQNKRFKYQQFNKSYLLPPIPNFQILKIMDFENGKKFKNVEKLPPPFPLKFQFMASKIIYQHNNLNRIFCKGMNLG